MTAFLHGIATAVPPHILPQTLVQERAQDILGPRYPQFERLLSTFTNAGIERRYSVAPLDWFEAPHGWADRNGSYLAGTDRLFLDAARGALAEAGWRADDVDAVVTVSSTGVATPTLEARAAAEMGFREDLYRVPVFGLGCAGGVSGLEIARAQAVARPGSKVLLVVAEACTLSFRTDRLQKADIIATVLFGDGAAAVCLSTEPGPVALGQGVQHSWRDTLDIMGWEVDDQGLGVVFDRSIPGFVGERFQDAARGALRRMGLAREAIDRFICHPGGAKVIQAIEAALGIGQGALEEEREVLRGFGNMSAPTVLFVLDRLLKQGFKGQSVAAALGPGFTASFLPIRVAA